jgi:hypothetical protein
VAAEEAAVVVGVALTVVVAEEEAVVVVRTAKDHNIFTVSVMRGWIILKTAVESPRRERFVSFSIMSFALLRASP